MPRLTREEAIKGTRLIGAAYPVDDVRRDRIRKGQFMTVDAQQPPRRVTNSAPPQDLAAGIAEIAARLQRVRDELQKVKR